MGWQAVGGRVVSKVVTKIGRGGREVGKRRVVTGDHWKEG